MSTITVDEKHVPLILSRYGSQEEKNKINKTEKGKEKKKTKLKMRHSMEPSLLTDEQSYIEAGEHFSFVEDRVKNCRHSSANEELEKQKIHMYYLSLYGEQLGEAWKSIENNFNSSFKDIEKPKKSPRKSFDDAMRRIEENCEHLSDLELRRSEEMVEENFRLRRSIERQVELVVSYQEAVDLTLGGEEGELVDQYFPDNREQLIDMMGHLTSKAERYLGLDTPSTRDNDVLKDLVAIAEHGEQTALKLIESARKRESEVFLESSYKEVDQEGQRGHGGQGEDVLTVPSKEDHKSELDTERQIALVVSHEQNVLEILDGQEGELMNQYFPGNREQLIDMMGRLTSKAQRYLDLDALITRHMDNLKNLVAQAKHGEQTALKLIESARKRESEKKDLVGTSYEETVERGEEKGVDTEREEYDSQIGIEGVRTNEDVSQIISSLVAQNEELKSSEKHLFVDIRRFMSVFLMQIVEERIRTHMVALTTLFQGHDVPIASSGRTLSVDSHPLARRVAYLHLSKTVIQNASALTNGTKRTLRCAAILAALMEKFKDLKTIFCAHVYTKCPLLAPFLPSDEGLDFIGTSAFTGAFFDHNQGLARFYAAVMVIRPPVGFKKSAEFSVARLWTLIARLSNGRTVPSLTASVLLGLLQVGGNSLKTQYSGQFWKLLVCVKERFQEEGTSQAIGLVNFIEDVLMTRSFPVDIDNI